MMALATVFVLLSFLDRLILQLTLVQYGVKLVG